MAIASPCVKICVFDRQAALCMGCGRTLAEIAGWLRLSDDERRRVMAVLPARLAAVRADEPAR